MSASTKIDPYCRASLSRLPRHDVEFGLQIRILVLESHLRTYLAAVTASRKLLDERHRPLPARLRRIAGCLELAEDAWAEFGREARVVAKIVDYLTGDDARVGAEIERALEGERGS
jgi:hypothetical protein